MTGRRRYVHPRRIVHAFTDPRVKVAMGSLEEIDRTLLTLRYVEGLTHREAAERVGLSSGYVGKRIRRAVETLADNVERIAKEARR